MATAPPLANNRGVTRDAKAAAKERRSPRIPKGARKPLAAESGKFKRAPDAGSDTPPPPSSGSNVARAPGRGKYDRTRSSDERQKEQMRRLLEAAAFVFAEKGWSNATVEAIVTRAGMSRRTFYEHFEDLRDCLLTLHRKVSKLSFRVVEARTQSAEQNPPEMLRAGIEGLLGGIAMFPHFARVMFREVRAAGPEFEIIHDQMMSRFATLVTSGVQKAYEMGRTKRPPDELRVFALVAAMEAVGMRYVMRGEEDKALEAAPVLIDMVQKTFS